MENPTPLKIWYALHLFATYLGINAILYLQGGDITLPMLINVELLVERGRGSTGLLLAWASGLALLVSMLVLLSLMRQLPKRSSKAGSVAPSMFGFDLVQHPDAAPYWQGFWLVVCLALSAWGTGHAARVALAAPVYACGQAESPDGVLVRPGSSGFGVPEPIFGHDRLRFDSCGQPPSVRESRGVEYIPIISDVLPARIACIDIVLVFVFWGMWWKAARQTRKQRPRSARRAVT